MPKNGSITSFFKPVPKSGSQSSSFQPRVRTPSPTRTQFRDRFREAASTSAAPSAAPQPLDSDIPPSSPLSDLLSSLPAGASRPLDRNTVIQDSEDEGSDDGAISSDDDLPSLFSRPAAGPVPPARKDPVCVTPRAKRTALEFHLSPLTIMPKHKFDFNALLKHAEADNALEESKRQIESMEAAEEAARTAKASSDGKETAASIHERMGAVMGNGLNSEDEGRRNKVLQAMKRTEIGESRTYWRFFDRPSQLDDDSPSIKARHEFPSWAATGVWGFLARDEGRSTLFEDGVPYKVQVATKKLPDEIFDWVLKDVLAEGPRRLRRGYFKLLSVCDDQVHSRVNPEYIDRLFKTTGAPDRIFTESSQGTGRNDGLKEYYPEKKDWSTLRSVLQVLIDISRSLSVESLTRSVSILLRLGIDNIIHEDLALARDFQDAIDYLVEAVPGRDWDGYCDTVCTSLYNYVKEPILRCDAASSIPLLRPRLVDLRRRLALACIFEDPTWAANPPETRFTLSTMIDRLHDGMFVIDRQRSDFFEVAALAELLGYAIGDGCPPPSGTDDFNKEVDELAQVIKIMWSSIHTGSQSPSRLDARVKLQALEKKLLLATRTRPPPKTNPFGIMHEETQDDVQLPKQQRFMERFFQGRGKEPEEGGLMG